MSFYNSKSDLSNFRISFIGNPTADFGIFAQGYFHAASALAEQVLEKPHFPDYEAYPIVFLYRHSFELYLKGILYSAALICAFKDLAWIDARVYNHKLSPLTQSCAQILTVVFPGNTQVAKAIDNVARVAREFEEIDGDSHSYRYPINKLGKASTKHHQVVNLRTLRDTMNETLDTLDTIDIGLDIEKSTAQHLYEVLEEAKALISKTDD